MMDHQKTSCYCLSCSGSLSFPLQTTTLCDKCSFNCSADINPLIVIAHPMIYRFSSCYRQFTAVTFKDSLFEILDLILVHNSNDHTNNFDG